MEAAIRQKARAAQLGGRVGTGRIPCWALAAAEGYCDEEESDHRKQRNPQLKTPKWHTHVLVLPGDSSFHNMQRVFHQTAESYHARQNTVNNKAVSKWP